MGARALTPTFATARDIEQARDLFGAIGATPAARSSQALLESLPGRTAATAGEMAPAAATPSGRCFPEINVAGTCRAAARVATISGASCPSAVCAVAPARR